MTDNKSEAASVDPDAEGEHTTAESESTDAEAADAASQPAAKKPKSAVAGGAVARMKAATTQWGRSITVATALALVVAIVGCVWLYFGKADAQRSRDAANARNQSLIDDLDSARKAAEGYTRKAITIDFNRSSDYVKELAVGTTQSFGESFALDDKGAGKLIVELQQQLRMVATGEVAYTLFDGDVANPPQAGQPWNMVVIANQTSTTAQQPDRVTQVLILKVVVVQLEGQWKVANFGPDPKSMGAASAIPGVK